MIRILGKLDPGLSKRNVTRELIDPFVASTYVDNFFFPTEWMQSSRSCVLINFAWESYSRAKN